MSCISLPDYPVDLSDDSNLEDISWPVLVQGIRVYARRQPPNVQSDLLKWADLFEAMGKIHGQSEQA